MNELEKCCKSYKQAVVDSKELNLYDYVKKYSGIQDNINDEINEEYAEYTNERGIEEEDRLTKKEWIEEVYLEEFNLDTLEQIKEEYIDPLEIEVYKNTRGDNYIYEITESVGGPNIFIKLNSRFNSAEYSIYWGSDEYTESLNYEDIYNYYNLEMYEDISIN